MAAFFTISAADLARAQPTFEPGPELPRAGALARALRPVTGVPVWFDLTPAHPHVDTRVEGNPAGVAASLETFGGTTGPMAPASGQGGVILAGRVAPVAGAGELPLALLRRQCGLRVHVDAPAPDRAGATLLLLRLHGVADAAVELYLGSLFMGAVALPRPTTVAVLVEPEGPLRLDLRARLAGVTDSALWVHGVAGHTL